MTNMIERIARAMWDVGQGPPEWDGASAQTRTHYRDLATAALRELLQPTEGMVEAGERAAWDFDNSMPAIRAMEKGFTAAIQAALKGE